MALSRSFLKGMGLTDEQVSAVIEAHAETVDALKEKSDEWKNKANKLENIEKEFKDFKANAAGNDEWKEKFEAEHKAFEDFKANLNADKAKEAKVDAYKKLLKDANVSDKLIDLVVKANAAEIEKLELDEKGTITTAEELKKTIAADYADYITDSSTEGAGTQTPPGNDGNNNADDLGKLSMDDYIKARTKK